MAGKVNPYQSQKPINWNICHLEKNCMVADTWYGFFLKTAIVLVTIHYNLIKSYRLIDFS